MATQADPIRLTRAGFVSVADLVVRNEADNERALATVQDLMCRQRTPEEDALLDVLTDLIEKFESKKRRGLRRDPPPHEMLRFLVQQNRLSQKDLWVLLGGKSHTSEILSGKRKVSNRQAGLLGKRFNVSPSVFISFA
ncbi:MAG: transcriptional regulator [Bryobacteraceae bacterium]|jgi:HTH-type transcriptional regulator/antitoxin HigA